MTSHLCPFDLLCDTDYDACRCILTRFLANACHHTLEAKPSSHQQRRELHPVLESHGNQGHSPFLWPQSTNYERVTLPSPIGTAKKATPQANRARPAQLPGSPAPRSRLHVGPRRQQRSAGRDVSGVGGEHQGRGALGAAQVHLANPSRAGAKGSRGVWKPGVRPGEFADRREIGELTSESMHAKPNNPTTCCCHKQACC